MSTEITLITLSEAINELNIKLDTIITQTMKKSTKIAIIEGVVEAKPKSTRSKKTITETINPESSSSMESQSETPVSVVSTISDQSLTAFRGARVDHIISKAFAVNPKYVITLMETAIGIDGRPIGDVSKAETLSTLDDAARKIAFTELYSLFKVSDSNKNILKDAHKKLCNTI